MYLLFHTQVYVAFMYALALFILHYANDVIQTFYAMVAPMGHGLLYLFLPSFHSKIGTIFYDGGHSIQSDCGNPILGFIVYHWLIFGPTVILLQILFNRLVLKINIFK